MQAVFLLLRVGLALYIVGLTRAKNSASVITRTVCDLAVASLAFYCIGATVLTSSFHHWTDPFAAAGVLPYLLLATVATGIVIGSVGERSRFMPTLVVSAALAAIVVPFLARWSQDGWLKNLDFIDAAGASWIHVAGGTVALLGAKLVGPRDNKYHRDGSASMIPGHSLPFAGIGALLMFATLYAVVSAGGALAAINALLAGASAVVGSLVLSHLRYGKPDVLIVLAGMLGGIVAISAGAGAMYPVWAIVVGAVAGILVPLAAVELDLRLHVDDPTNAVAIHLVGGAWGTIAAGIFCGRGVLGTLKAIGVQSLGLAAAVAVAGAVGLVTYKLLAGKLRSTEADETDGLDLAEHDVGAYPDFQQISIRSYHLREA